MSQILNDNEIKLFKRDGAVFLRNKFDINVLLKGLLNTRSFSTHLFISPISLEVTKNSSFKLSSSSVKSFTSVSLSISLNSPLHLIYNSHP